jgi:4-hydroxy-3-polyprenylbenzoate decarboxylase
VLTKWGVRTLLHETPYTKAQVESLATAVHNPSDMGAAISSGSFRTDGMIVAPCSAKSLGRDCRRVRRQPGAPRRGRDPQGAPPPGAGAARAPLSDIHLENMLKLSRMGAI